jgi:hypothetical protein
VDDVMALEGTFRELTIALHKLHDALNAVQVTLGDKPLDRGAAVADGLENAVLDVMGALHDARKSALEAQRAVAAPMDLDRARRALTLCQEHFHAIEQQFASELVSYEKLAELARVGRARGREWGAWANSTKEGIEECRAPLDQLSQALITCWQELAERLGTTNISVHTTSIGQQIRAAKSELGELEIEGVT